MVEGSRPLVSLAGHACWLRGARMRVLALLCVASLLGCGGKGATADAQSAAAPAAVPGSASLAGADSRCVTEVEFIAEGNVPAAPGRSFPTQQLFPRDIPDRGTRMAVNTRMDGTARGWVDAKPFVQTYWGCANRAFDAALAAGRNPCEVAWVQTAENDGSVTNQGVVDVRRLATVEGAPLTEAIVEQLPSSEGFIPLNEQGAGGGAWFAKAHVLTAVTHSARCPVQAAAVAPPVAPPANGEPSGNLQLLCEYQNGQAIVVRVDERARSASVRLSTEAEWVTFVDGRSYEGQPPMVDAVAVNASAIRITRVPSDLGPEAKLSENEAQNEMGNLLLGLGALLATSSSATIDRNTGVIRSEGLGGVFLHKGVGMCQPWEGQRF